jgi:hypothetical protein
LNIRLVRVKIPTSTVEEGVRGMREELQLTAGGLSPRARGHLRLAASDGLVIAALTAATRAPGERRSSVDRRAGRDRRSLLRLEHSAPGPDRRREERRGRLVTARDFAAGWDQGRLRRRLTALRQLARKG